MQDEGVKKLVFKTVPPFWDHFDKLPKSQQDLARETFKTFKKNPFDPKLKAHKINRLTAIYKTTVFGITIDGNLRAVFCKRGNVVVSLDIGTHDIYK